MSSTVSASVNKNMGRTNILDLYSNTNEPEQHIPPTTLPAGPSPQQPTLPPQPPPTVPPRPQPPLPVPNPPLPPPPQPNQPDEEGEEIGEKQNPTFTFLGYKFDTDSAIVMGLLVFIWFIVWKSTGLLSLVKYDLTFLVVFILFIIYCIINLYTSDTVSGSIVYELNILTSVEQMVAILYGTMVLFTLFHHFLPILDGCKNLVFKILISIVIIMTIISMWVNVFVTGRAFRALRKFKQGIYNIALILFLLVALIYIKQKDCSNLKF